MQKKKLREDRQTCIDLEAERIEKRDDELQKARDVFEETIAQQKADLAKLNAEKGSDADSAKDEDEEDEEFDEEDFIAKFDDENPAVEIPAEVIDDIDNDYNLESDEEPMDA